MRSHFHDLLVKRPIITLLLFTFLGGIIGYKIGTPDVSDKIKREDRILRFYDYNNNRKLRLKESSALLFESGDQVELMEERIYPKGDTLKKGSIGTIVRGNTMERSYTVKFEGAKMLHKVPEDILMITDCCAFLKRK